MTDDSQRAALKALLAKHEDEGLGLEAKRTVRVIYATSDGRERIGWHEALKMKIRRRFQARG